MGSAAIVSLLRMNDERIQWWRWPNLLCLVAPGVALAWLYMFAYVWQVNYLPGSAYAALALAVWLIYILDHSIELKLRSKNDFTLSARHYFIARHPILISVLAVAALIALLILQLWYLPVNIIQFYCWPGIILVILFYRLALSSFKSQEIPYLRNFVAGLAFAYGTAMMAHIYVGTQGVWDLLISRKMLSFALLCTVNITAIHVWEYSKNAKSEEQETRAEIGLTMPLIILACAAILFAWKENQGSFLSYGEADNTTQPFFYAILISAALLLFLNRKRHQFSIEVLQTLADVALLLPLPIFLILANS